MAEIAHHKPITKAQIKSIHVALSRHGIDDDTYRAKLDAMFSVSSCKALSRRDASVLLKSLGYTLQNRPTPSFLREQESSHKIPSYPRGHKRASGKPAKPKPKTKLPSTVVSLPSPAQRQFIAALVGEIAWRVAGGYEHWLQKNMGLNHVATAQQAAQVIEGLKTLKAHQTNQ